MKAFCMLVLVVVLGFLAAPDGFAAIYKYTDKDGMISFADDPQSIPEPYRASAILVSGQPEEQNEPPLQPQMQTRKETRPVASAPSLEQETGAPEENKDSLFSLRFLITAIVVVSALFSFVILGMFDSDHKKSIKIIRVVVIWGVSIYVIAAHMMDVVHLFNMATGKIEAIQEESAEKGRKTARKMKEYKEAMDQLGKPDGIAEADPEKQAQEKQTQQ